MGQGVRCTHCGASTPLPDDLLIETFTCRFCATTLSTAAFAGEGAVRVDEMKAYLSAAIESPPTSYENAPKLVHGTAGFRRMPCVHCAAPIDVPLQITVPRVRCDACGREEFVKRYISDVERLQIDMARQVQGNQALKALIASGVSCGRCGANNPLSEPVEIQMSCRSCGHVILMKDHVPADAIDRARLKAAVVEIHEAAKQQHADRSRTVAIFTVVIVVVAIAIAIAASLASN